MLGAAGRALRPVAGRTLATLAAWRAILPGALIGAVTTTGFVAILLMLTFRPRGILGERAA